MNKAACSLVAISMLFASHAYAQVTPGGPGYNDLSQSRSFTVTTPGAPSTYVRPWAGGGYIATTPGQPETVIRPWMGGGYTVTTPGRPDSVIRPNN